MWTFIKNAWNSFEAWVDSWLPQVKTLLVSFLGMVGSGAAIGQQYLTGLPTTTFVTATQLSVASLVLFTLAFWFHGLSDRVAANASVPQSAS